MHCEKCRVTQRDGALLWKNTAQGALGRRHFSLKELWPSGRPKLGQVHPQKTVAYGLILKCTEKWRKPNKEHKGTGKTIKTLKAADRNQYTPLQPSELLVTLLKQFGGKVYKGWPKQRIF